MTGSAPNQTALSIHGVGPPLCDAVSYPKIHRRNTAFLGVILRGFAAPCESSPRCKRDAAFGGSNLCPMLRRARARTRESRKCAIRYLRTAGGPQRWDGRLMLGAA